jgi:hypothetical protein
MLCVALVMIVQIDQLVNSTLYSFGLVFNDSWAQPYWLMLRVTMITIVAAIILISVVELPYPAFQEKTEEPEQKQQEKEPEFVAKKQETSETLVGEKTELTINKPEEAESLTVEEMKEPVSSRFFKKRKK